MQVSRKNNLWIPHQVRNVSRYNVCDIPAQVYPPLVGLPALGGQESRITSFFLSGFLISSRFIGIRQECL